MSMPTIRTAFVTGAAQGLGNAIAKALGQANYQVVYADINKSGANKAAETAAGPACAVEVDVTSRASIRAAIAEAKQTFGPIDILINNAALTIARPFMDIQEDEWDSLLAVNLRGILLASQTIVPDMVERGWGRIINLTSLAGQRGGPQIQGAHYATSKAGIIGLTRYMAHEFAPAGITVNAIAPGPVLTEATAKAPADKLAAVASQIPVGHIGDAAHVGALACYLVSDQASFVTGTTMDINGGLLMR